MALLSSNGNPLQMQCPPNANGGPAKNENNANNGHHHHHHSTHHNHNDVYQFSTLMSNFPGWDLTSSLSLPTNNQFNLNGAANGGGSGSNVGNGTIGSGIGNIGGGGSVSSATTSNGGILSDNYLLSHVFGAIGQQVQMHHSDLDTPGSSPLTDDGMVSDTTMTNFFRICIYKMFIFNSIIDLWPLRSTCSPSMP